VTEHSGNKTTLSTVPEYTELAKFKDSYSIDGLSGLNSNAQSDFGTVMINGEERPFMYGYSVYYFTILNRRLKIKITKDQLENLPSGYNFQDIVIQ
jgi:hypothetical protein